MIKYARRLAHVVVAAALAAGALVAVGATSASAADPVGYAIAAGEGECWLMSVDLVTGEATQLGTPSSDKCAFDLEFSPDGTTLYGTRVEKGDTGSIATLLEFDLSTGDVTPLGQLGDFNVGGPGSDQGNLTFGPDGALYTYLVPGGVEAPSTGAVDPACDGSAFCLFRGTATTPGALTYVNSVPQSLTVYWGLATSCGGTTSSLRDALDSASQAGWAVPHADVSIASQVLTQVNRTATGPGTTDVGPVGNPFLSSLDYDTAGTLYAVGFDQESVGPSLFTVDPATGAATQLTTLNDGSEPINVGVLGFAVAHPCTTPTPPTPPTPPAPPAAQPLAAIAPRFTG